MKRGVLLLAACVAVMGGTAEASRPCTDPAWCGSRFQAGTEHQTWHSAVRIADYRNSLTVIEVHAWANHRPIRDAAHGSECWYVFEAPRRHVHARVNFCGKRLRVVYWGSADFRILWQRWRAYAPAFEGGDG